ncbi:alkylphosphonate utilization protein [Flavobacteriaceae bacterium]|jgi:protein PhnA|nr:alkylphosphonate utilization protein [Flavobacteriaceae bacterium]MBT4313239.1 alkylphosphonate utilization protein [Flavobacteriaceae bacterium]MBT5091957.1 alkylphosphonate utilization protein [Flavobacteriaceae bacterium]MBT5282573.1 alkylphosphonate utilization protein [Flavobacteriaceae bacterium]MBT5446341.1 alkylphosphonate utilization protein [Flavobacteriaceae bacterium]|tara:strand:- start:14838 stop:15047 length:210 start_codon:yes stop_codon:yes gene_type:complete
MNVTDINGNALVDGDSVKLTKDLKVKGAGITLKRGTVVKNIRVTESSEEIDCKIKKTSIILRTEFVQKM